MRNKRFILISTSIFFFFVLIGYFEPLKEVTSPNHKLELKQPNSTAAKNIKAFAKLYGYIRYFHPSDEASELNWNSFAVYGVQEVVNAKDSKELESKLKQLFLPIAPTVQIYSSKKNTKQLTMEESSKLIAWQHLGLGDSKNLNSTYESKRVISDSEHEIKLFHKTLKANTLINKDINSEIKAQIPIVLYTNGNETIGATEDSLKAFEELKYNLEYVGTDGLTSYLANTIILWNVFQHFYPDLKSLGIDWDQELDNTLANLLKSKNDAEYETNFQLFLDKLADGHISYLAKPVKNNFLPLSIDWINNELTVTASESNAIYTGDRILKINDIDATEYVAKLAREMSGSEPWKKQQSLKEVLSSDSPDKELSLEINRDGKVLKNIKVTFNWYMMDDFNRSSKEPLYEIDNGIYYINHTLINDYQLANNLEALSTAKGIIIDLRGYPEEFKVGKDIISHLIDTPVKSPIIQVPKVILPDQEEMEFESIQWEVEPVSPKLNAKVVYLTYGESNGDSELFLEIVKKYRLGEIVGQQTPGENVGANSISLFNRDKIYWTGSKVLKHDGSQHHLIGVKPTYTVERNIEAIKQGKDEYIEKAIEIINRN